MNEKATQQTAEGADLRELMSALVDGQLGGSERNRCLDRLCTDERARTVWALWHAAGDALRSSEVAAQHSAGFSARIARALEAEPSIVAPRALSGRHRAVRRILVPGAAVAAAVLVLSLVAVPMIRSVDPVGVEVARVQGTSQPAGLMSPVIASVARTRPEPEVARSLPVDDAQFDAYVAAHAQIGGSLGLSRTSVYLRQGSAGSGSPGGR